MADLIGQTIGNYRIEAPLGAGGMGQVFRGRHVHLDRVAAVKVMHDNMASDPGFQARFRQEARAVAALRHPNILEVIDFGEEGGRFYLIMEFVSGGSLRGVLQRHAKQGQAIPLGPGLDLMRQAAEGLGYAHQQGMVHRDVKPDNMLLETGGQTGVVLKISDFGLARLAEGSVMTASGVTMGTPAYMSPEQCQGGDMDGRCDLYSLGVVLYEVATGFLPFEVKTLSEAVYKHVYAEPTRPREVCPSLPEELEQIILRCLAKHPDDRYATGAQLAAELSRVSANPVVPTLDRTLLVAARPATAQPAQGKPHPTPAVGTVARQMTAMVTPPPAHSLEPVAGLPQIQVLDAQGQRLDGRQLSGDGLTIGRLADNDLILAPDAISRHHLRVDWDGARVTVTDLGSSNGSLLEGSKLLPQMAQEWPWRGMVRVGPFWLRLEPPANQSNSAVSGFAPGVGAMAGAALPGANQFTRQEPASVSGSVGVVLERDSLTLTPGQPAVLRATVANLGARVDHVHLSADGVPPDWVQNGSDSVQLNPGAQAPVALTICVPRSPEARAGEYGVTVRAISRENPHQSGGALARWNVQPFRGSVVSMAPARSGGSRQASYTVKLRNEGNAAESFALHASDDEQALQYRFAQERVTLEPGAAAAVKLTVHAEPHWMGAAQNRAFAVTADPEVGDGPPPAAAQFIHRAMIPMWVPPVGAAALAAAVWLGGQMNKKPTPTPNNGTQVAQTQQAVQTAVEEKKEAAQDLSVKNDAAEEAQRAAAEAQAEAQRLAAQAASDRSNAAAQQAAQQAAAEAQQRQQEAAQAAQERAEAARVAQQKAADERAARQQAEAARASQEQAAHEQAARDKAAQQEQAARDKAAQEQAARDKAAQEQAARDKAAQEQAARDKEAAEQAAREKEAAQQATMAREATGIRSAVMKRAGGLLDLLKTTSALAQQVAKTPVKPPSSSGGSGGSGSSGGIGGVLRPGGRLTDILKNNPRLVTKSSSPNLFQSNRSISEVLRLPSKDVKIIDRYREKYRIPLPSAEDPNQALTAQISKLGGSLMDLCAAIAGYGIGDAPVTGPVSVGGGVTRDALPGPDNGGPYSDRGIPDLWRRYTEINPAAKDAQRRGSLDSLLGLYGDPSRNPLTSFAGAMAPYAQGQGLGDSGYQRTLRDLQNQLADLDRCLRQTDDYFPPM